MPPLGDRARVAAFLSDDTAVLADRVIGPEPWLCRELGVDLPKWSRELLAAHGLTKASLSIIGSAATGFSLNPENAGRPFRKVGGVGEPSDLDVAVVDEGLFVSCWESMVGFERTGGPSHIAEHDRSHVYWGRIDDYVVPPRTAPRVLVRRLLDSVRRVPGFRGYPANIRVYRRREDLFHYVIRGLQALSRSLAE